MIRGEIIEYDKKFKDTLKEMSCKMQVKHFTRHFLFSNMEKDDMIIL